jgi:4-oxalocrotonate tautomerase
VPFIDVTIVEGRDPERVRAMISKVTDAVEAELGVKRQSIRVVVREVPPTHWAAGDVTIAERDGVQS